jgi:hypothetical protein
VIISCGVAGLPGQISYMATNLPVTQAMGLPIAPLGLLLAVDTIPDVFPRWAMSPPTWPPPVWWPGNRARILSRTP